MLADTVKNVKLETVGYGGFFLVMTIFMQTVQSPGKCITELAASQAKTDINLLTLVTQTKLYCREFLYIKTAKVTAGLGTFESPAVRERDEMLT